MTQAGLCAGCELCAVVYPTATITRGDTVETDQEVCILCFACVKNDSAGARVRESPPIMQISEWLHNNFHERKEPEVYV